MRTWADEVEDQRRERDREQRRLIECQHGALRRQCEICERDDRIEELEAALRPFSVFHAALVKLGGASPKNADFYTIQAGVEAAVTLRIEDFAAAAKAVQK